MLGYPNPSRDIREVIPMTEYRLLEPSFADAIAAIEKADDLPAGRKTHLICSLRQIAKMLGRPVESIAARWGAVAIKVNRLHHADGGVEWKTLANHKANAKAALFWFCKEKDNPFRGAPLIEEWRKLRCQISDLSRRGRLSGLIRYCSIKNIMPAEVNDSVVEMYMHYRAETTALATDIKAKRSIARAWNACRILEGWPQQALTEPPLTIRTDWPCREDFPASLRREMETYLASMSRFRRNIAGKRLGPCKQITIKTRRNELFSLAKKAVRLGTPIEGITSLAVLLNPSLVEKVIDSEWEKAGAEPKGSTIDLGKKLVAVARSVGGLDKEAMQKLEDIRSTLEQHRIDGMTPKNMKLIRQVLNGDVWKRVVNYPKKLMKEARLQLSRSPLKAAVNAEVAIATALETMAPIRARNLVSIRLDENLIRPGGLESNYLLVFPHYDVKNRVDLSFELDEELTDLIDEYVQDFRPTLMRGSNADWLFPGTNGNPKNPHLFGIQISDRIKKATGLSITLHQFRHAAAAIYLRYHPGDYETVRRFLGHRSIKTTTNFYCSLETITASRMFGKIVRQHVRSDPELPGE